MEHRFGIRHPANLPVFVARADGSRPVIGTLLDVSVSGCFVATHFPRDALKRVQVWLSISPGDAGGTELNGHVMRTTGRGIGIEWAEDQPELVREVVAQNEWRLTDRRAVGALTDQLGLTDFRFARVAV
jgi:PilZ domain